MASMDMTGDLWWSGVLMGAGGVLIGTWLVAVLGGRRSKSLIQRLERLEGREGVKIINAPVFHAPVAQADEQRSIEPHRIGRIMESVAEPTVVGHYDKDNGVIYINTIHGCLTISTRDPEVTMTDLAKWLDKYGILEPLKIDDGRRDGG